jgi:pre-rRNA-processing protein TSR1
VLGEGWVAPGQYVCLHLANVPYAAAAGALAAAQGVPLFLTSLLRHENRTSVMHYNIQRWPGYTGPIKGRDHLEFHVGWRVFDARPVFSQQGANCDKNKMDRFLQQGRWTTATAYAPITYAPQPVLVYKRVPVPPPAGEGEGGADGNASATLSQPATAPPGSLYPSPDRLEVDAAGRGYRLQLVAVGSVLGADPDRVLLKKVVLSGYPVKVKNRTAVVKFLFFNPADILWFQPVDLWTKHGLSGVIREPLGTHGHLKASFDRVIKQHDTVCMSLFKRVYPRWGDCYRGAVGEEADEHALTTFGGGSRGAAGGGGAGDDERMSM